MAAQVHGTLGPFDSMQIIFIPTCSASIGINSVTSSQRPKKVLYMIPPPPPDFSGNNARIIGSHSGIIGQFCKNRRIEL